MRKGYLVALLVAVSLFSTINYIRVTGEKQRLLKNLYQINNKIAYFENEIRKQEDDLIQKITQTDSELAESKNTIKQLKINIAMLEEEKQKLNQGLTALREQNESLQQRWRSLKELKKAIREIEKEKHLAKKPTEKPTEKPTLKWLKDIITKAEGNQGYLVRDGKSTFKKKSFKIEVIPVDADSAIIIESGSGNTNVEF